MTAEGPLPIVPSMQPRDPAPERRARPDGGSIAGAVASPDRTFGAPLVRHRR